jgi:hypothetical protein
MQIQSQENAMTEIALALAMGFFSIMVLTMVSMGVEPAAGGRDDAKAVQVLKLAAPARSDDTAGAILPSDDDVIVVYDGTRFLDRNLEPLDVAAIDPARRVILALDPALPVQEALKIRGRIANSQLIVSSLDDRWQAALAERKGDGS